MSRNTISGLFALYLSIASWPSDASIKVGLFFNDELVEVTPDAIRLRKKYLNEHERLQYNKRRKAAQQQ